MAGRRRVGLPALLKAGEGETHFELSIVEYSREADKYLPAETVWIVSLQTELSLD